MQQRHVAIAMQLFTSDEMQLGDWQGTVENGTVANANSSICARAESKLLKLVSLIHMPVAKHHRHIWHSRTLKGHS